MLFENTKAISLKLSVLPISDLWKRSQICLVHEFIGKKAKPSRDSVLEFWSSWDSEKGSIFFHLCIQEGHVDNLLVILKKKGYICIGERI